MLVVLVALLLAAGCGKGEKGQDYTLDAGGLQCERDDHSRPQQAAQLAAGEAREGFICPEGDRDWYRLEVPADQTILHVGLEMAVALSPIEANYTVWTIDEDGEPGSVAAAPLFTAVGEAIADVHCLDPGDYLLSVSDAGDNSADLRNAYELSLETSADGDQNEPNNTRESATVLSSAQTASGYITCPGDDDRYQIDVPAGNLLKLSLESEVADYEPRLELVDADDNVIVQQTNRAGRVRSTVIERFATLAEPGRYDVIVSDDDDYDADPEVPYELTVELVPDTDPNEPNNTVETATELSDSPLSCGGSWSSWVEHTGTVGAPGDIDWFEVDLQNCDGGILEAHLEFDTSQMSGTQKWEFNSEVQAALSMVVSHTDSPCNENAECASLQKSCDGALGCAGLLEQCLGEGLCAGAAVCMPGGFCGANRVERHYECDPRLDECQAVNSPSPPPNEARFAAPLPQGSPVFLRASDFQANGAAPDTSYRLRVRVRDEPDAHEPSNIFTNEIDRSLPVSRHLQYASEVPVHDCTGADPTCCDTAEWTTGAISYENDLDWFQYQHPCPDQDCLLRFHYRTDAGPVDTLVNVYRGSRAWYTVLSADEEQTQAAQSGFVGGTAETDRCFYAYQGHTGDPFQYSVLVRDVRELHSDGNTPVAASSDWDPAQEYSFCIEKVFDGCDTPCEVAENGCTTP